MSDTLVKVENTSKKYCRSLKKSLWYGMLDLGHELVGSRRESSLRADEFWAVHDASFEIKRGECLGLIGRNGAGKTTLLKMLNGQIRPDCGRIEIRGRVGALIALGAGFNPILTGRENIYVNAAVLGLTKKETDRRLEEIVEFAELAEFIDSPVQTYSSGMAVRLGFSIATTLEPDVMFIDEVLAVGDAAFRVKCYNKLMGLRDRMATIFVSHSMPQVAKLCTSGLILVPNSPAPTARPVSEAILAYNENLSTFASYFEGLHSACIDAIRIEQDGGVASFLTPWPPQPRHVGELKGDAPLCLVISIESFPSMPSIMALWSVTDIDQRLIGQTAAAPVTPPTIGGRFELVTRIDAFQLNSGRYTLSVHLLTSANGEWGEVVAGLRDVLSFSIVRDGFMGSAGILYPARSHIAVAHQGLRNGPV